MAVEVVAEPIDQAAEDIDVALHPQQELMWWFHQQKMANEFLFGGAKGGGKSGLLRIGGILLCMTCPGLQLGLFRRTYRQLQDNHMEGHKSYPEILGKMVNKGTASITAHDVRFWNGSHISLNHLATLKDAYGYSGRGTFHGMEFDEATQIEEAQYRFLAYSVMRLGGWKPPEHMAGMFPFVWNGANPGGPSHSFFKKGFVDNGAYNIVRSDVKEGSMLRMFIPSRAEDNPTLLKDDPGYLDRLEASGDPSMVRALREGDWSVVAGGMFEQWRATMHGRPWHVHSGFRIPEGWSIWRGGDDGYANPAAVYWLTQDPTFNTIYVIDELYKAQMLPDEEAERILERDRLIPVGNKFVTQDWNDMRGPPYNRETLRGSYDSNAFAVTGTGSQQQGKEISRGDQMNRKNCRWTPVEKWPGSKLTRIKNLHRLLAPNPKSKPMLDADGAAIIGPNGKALTDRPGIVFFQKCVNAIELIPQLTRSERDREDLAETANDHSFDGVTYAVQHRIGKSRMIELSGI